MGAVKTFGRNVELGVVGITVEMEAMLGHDVSKGKHVEDEEGTKH